MTIGRLYRNVNVELKAFLTSGGVPSTGKTVQLAIQRDSDYKYYQWDGVPGTWDTSIVWTNAAELGNGVYGKNWLTPNTNEQYTVLWKETTIPYYDAVFFIVDDTMLQITAINGTVATILVDTADMQPKVNTINTRVDQSLSSTESNIRGADNDDLKDISDQIDTTESNIRGADNDDLKDISDQIDDLDNLIDLQNYEAFVDGKFNIPSFQGTLASDLPIGATTATLKSTQGLPTYGYIKVNDEIIFWNGTTATQLQNLVRAKFGTTQADHTEGDSIYHIIVREAWTRVTGPDGKVIIPTVVPKISVSDVEGNAILGSTNMTALVNGIYFHRFFITKALQPTTWRLRFFFNHEGGETSDSDLVKDVELTDEPASSDEVRGLLFGGDLYFDQDGYKKSDGTAAPWTDVMKGPIVDGFGSPVGGVIVRAIPVVNGERLTSDRFPPYDNRGMLGTDSFGKYFGYLDPGTYDFTFKKEGQTFQAVRRTLTDS